MPTLAAQMAGRVLVELVPGADPAGWWIAPVVLGGCVFIAGVVCLGRCALSAIRAHSVTPVAGAYAQLDVEAAGNPAII